MARARRRTKNLSIQPIEALPAHSGLSEPPLTLTQQDSSRGHPSEPGTWPFPGLHLPHNPAPGANIATGMGGAASAVQTTNKSHRQGVTSCVTFGVSLSLRAHSPSLANEGNEEFGPLLRSPSRTAAVLRRIPVST